MILVFGGAYQGKTEYARERFDVKTICECDGKREPDFTADAVSGIENFVFECAETGRDAVQYFMEHSRDWEDSVLILTDTSQGVVPIDGSVRAAREMNGRLMLYLAGQADEVHRVFCGIGKRIK